MVPWLQDGESGTPSVEEKVRLLLNEQQTVSGTLVFFLLSAHIVTESMPAESEIFLSLQVSLEDQKEHLLSEFSQSPVKPAVQQLLHRYLRYNHYHLPMYAQPDIL